MLLPLGLALGLILVLAAIHYELRSAFYGIALSNGIEVLVSPATYRAIVDRYRTLDESEAWERWDQAVLDILRRERPNEWRYLVRTLGYHVSREGLMARRKRQAVRR